MTQIPIVSGIYGEDAPDWRTAYPRNMYAVPKDTGISSGYLRTSEAVIRLADGPGTDGGGTIWRNEMYRVMGGRLIKVSETGDVTDLGAVGGSGRAHFAGSFDHLAIASDDKLFLWDGLSLQQVTDIDLGAAKSVTWMDGYFITTDGAAIVITDLNDPFSVNQLKYGSSELDPDPIQSVIAVAPTVYAINRYSIEGFYNAGTSGFPFKRISGSGHKKGAVGRFAACPLDPGIAFVGGARGAGNGVYVLTGGSVSKISTREIDAILDSYGYLGDTFLETREFESHKMLLVHLVDQTLCFDVNASADMGRPVWSILHGGTHENPVSYPASGISRVGNTWIGGNPNGSEIVKLDDTGFGYLDMITRWEFSTQVIYSEGISARLNSVEIVSPSNMTGHSVSMQWSDDGQSWSMPHTLPTGRRLQFRRLGAMSQRKILKFWGDGPFNATTVEAMFQGGAR